MIHHDRIKCIEADMAEGSGILPEDVAWMLQELSRRGDALESYNRLSRENAAAYVEVARRALDLTAILKSLRVHPEDRPKLVEVRRSLSDLARMPAPGQAIADRIEELEAREQARKPKEELVAPKE